MYDIDIPEYGRQVRLLTPYRGYNIATIIGRDGLHFVVQLSSGLELHVYSDEFEFD